MDVLKYAVDLTFDLLRTALNSYRTAQITQNAVLIMGKI